MFIINSMQSKKRFMHSFYRFTTTSKEIEQHKPTPAQIYARKHNIMEHKFLLNCYKMLQVQQTQSYDKISANYIYLKKQYSNRHYYLPNKKEYLLRLDEAYAKIMEVHPQYNYLEMGKQTGLITKQDIVHYELQSIRKQVYINLLNSYDTALIILLIVFIVDSMFEEIAQEKNKKPVTLAEEISVFKAIKQMISQITKKFQNDVEPLIIKPDLQKFLQQNKIDRQNSPILKNAITLQAYLTEKKKQSLSSSPTK